jgi:hydrogenase maturation protease
MASRVLILAVGNPLRSDDGVAWHAADLLCRRLSPDEAEIIFVHQLMPELAERVSQADGAIFLDARQNGQPGQVIQTPVILEAEGMYSTHMLAPVQLTALSYVLFGNRSKAFEVSVTGDSFVHGEELSHAVKNALPQLVRTVVRLAKQIRRDHGINGSGNMAASA